VFPCVACAISWSSSASCLRLFDFVAAYLSIRGHFRRGEKLNRVAAATGKQAQRSSSADKASWDWNMERLRQTSQGPSELEMGTGTMADALFPSHEVFDGIVIWISLEHYFDLYRRQNKSGQERDVGGRISSNRLNKSD